MQKIIPACIVLAVILIAGWLTWGSLNLSTRQGTSTTTVSVSTSTATEPTVNVCNADAKICSDGSTVGRTGPSCEFAACPPVAATSATIRTTMGQVMSGLGVSITPHAVVDDSRCPTDVQCIWAGTVKVRATITLPDGANSEETLEIGKQIEKGSFSITFTELTPAPHSGQTIPDSSYRFVFVVEKK